jgi:two-component system, cell cycle sensor histidine kinase and response regulator CckA
MIPACGLFRLASLNEALAPDPSCNKGIQMFDWRGDGTILVVDDEQQVRTITELMLTQFGFKVLTAEDGAAGVRTFADHADEIDLVVMDLTMPKLSGEQAFVEMRKRRPDARIVLTSGYNESEAVGRLASSGVTAFLQKPFELEQLLTTVRRALEAA